MAVIAFTTDGALLRGADDVISTDGVDDCILFGYTGMSADGGDISFVRERNSGNTLYSEGNSLSGTKYVWIQNPTDLRFDVQIVDDLGTTITNALFSSVSTENKLIRFTRVGDTISLYVDGVFQASDIWANGATTIDKSAVGCLSRTSDSNFYGATFSYIKLGDSEYIKNGDYGSPNLPSTPSGADGTINGATWGKVLNGDLVEFWDDWELYLAQLPVVPVEFQNCTRIDVYSPDTGDPLWLAYSDPMWLVVNDQAEEVEVYLFKPNNMSLKLSMEL